jgi:hypothetical protein
MGVFDPFTKGTLWRWGFQSYPARDRNGSPNRVWGNVRYGPGLIFNPDQQCVRDFADHATKSTGMVVWDAAASESPLHPDSVVMMFGIRQECYRFGVTIECSSTDGAYWDNLSLMIVDGNPAPVGASIWDLFQDTFPQNETPGLPAFAAKFDTCGALVKSGINIAPSTGTTRFDVPGDSVAVTTSPAVGGARVDLVFRVLPGPGNYVTLGRPDLSTLRKVPTSPAAIAGPVPNSTNFWESYLADNGPYGTPGGHTGAVWNPNVWNSARCDSAEVSGLFAFQSRALLGGPLVANVWHSTYHESEFGITPAPALADPFPVMNRRGGLGIVRHRCFVAAAGAALTDIDCVHDVGTTGPGYNLTYISVANGTSNPATGYDGATYDVGSGPFGGSTTVEGTKIIPDGLLTPGASVQYFFRKEDGANPGVNAGMMPDTNVVFPQVGEGSFDGHRWQYFGVLPDRWKDADYRHPVFGSFGLGEACLLVVDNDDRRGDERVWVGAADTIGATGPNKYGAHNGWHARGDQDVNDVAARVSVHGGIPGTTWDLYNVKGSESLNTGAGSIGNRLAYRNGANPQINNKVARLGPTPEMMNAFYPLVLLLSGDLNSGILGPFSNRTQDDVDLLTQWIRAGGTSSAERGFHAIGNGFVESNFNEGPGSDQDQFNVNVLGVTLRNNSYALESGNIERTPDLIASAMIANPASTDIFGVQNLCLWTNDVLERTAGLISETNDAMRYEDAGPGPFPIPSTVVKTFSGTRPYYSMVDGFDLQHLRSRYDADARGRARYVHEVYWNVFANVCQTVGYCDPICIGAVDDRPPLDVLGIPANNPLRAGISTIAFELAVAGRVEADVYDVSGRQVRVLARRAFPAGSHTLAWDGADDAGSPLPRGVYFAKIRFADRGVEGTRRIIVLR